MLHGLCVNSHTESGTSISVAAVYGLASKPLSKALDGVADLISALTRPLPATQDTAVEPDFKFLCSFSQFALRVMQAQGHWEGVVSVGMRVCEGVTAVRGDKGDEWVGELVPVILEAQSQLARRVDEHSADLTRKG